MSYYLDNSFDHSQSNIFDGHNFYDQNNNMIGSSHPNIFGGYDIYDNHSQVIAHSSPNIFDGTHVYDNSGHTIYDTQPSAIGSSVFDGNHHYLGNLHDTLTGQSFTDLNGVHSSWHQNLFDGVSLDPLSNMQNITFPPLI